jgi:hypothetical protein
MPAVAAAALVVVQNMLHPQHLRPEGRSADSIVVLVVALGEDLQMLLARWMPFLGQILGFSL